MTPLPVGEIAERLRAGFEGAVEVDRPLARLTTYRLGGHAVLYVEPSSPADLATLGRVLSEHTSNSDGIPILSLGRGSNVVVSDLGWPGIAIRLPGASWSWIEETSVEERPGLRAGASTTLPLVANWAARRGFAGAEFGIAIPGSVGGAVRMNAGAHGREIRDVLATARVFDLDRLEIDNRPNADLGFSYRSSNLTERHIVLDATLALDSANVDDVRDRMESYRRHRAATQPGAVQNAGSVFKNPPGDHAGRLVDAAGLKGFRIGGASVSELHANFFVADEGASAQDVFDLVNAVRARVHALFGVDLVPEIRFVGSFIGAEEVSS
jgi:UDP-N-acetylmuramate dehydrogenase